MSRALCLVPLVTLWLACAEGGTTVRTCDEGCDERSQVCKEGICVCAENYVDCDANPANGCEPAATCRCAYEGDEAFCARNGATCGVLAAPNNCGNRVMVECGSCSDDEVCGAERANTCGKGICLPETEAELCAAEGWVCGHEYASNRCGELLGITCGRCPPGTYCGPRKTCINGALDEYDVCMAGGREVGVCGSGLQCIGDGTTGVCLRFCGADDQCLGAGESCGLILDHGFGICGTPRGWRQSCQSPFVGPNFCWEPEAPNSYLTCVFGACEFICDIMGVGEMPCPGGMGCGVRWFDMPLLGIRARVCERF